MVNRLALARDDLAAAFDRAIRKAATPKIARALCTLRTQAEDRLRRAAEGSGWRSPAEITAEVLDRLRDIAGGRVEALAKRASGRGHRVVGDQRIVPASLPRPALEGAELMDALTAIGKEFRELADKARKTCKTPNSVLPFGRWEQRFRRDLWNALHVRDLRTAQAILSDAQDALKPILDDAVLDRAIGEEHGEKALIPGWTKAI